MLSPPPTLFPQALRDNLTTPFSNFYSLGCVKIPRCLKHMPPILTPVTPMVETILGFFGTVLLAVASWLYTIGSRVTTLEANHIAVKDIVGEKAASLEKLINAKFEAQGDRLERIERSMNGHLQRD